MENTKFTCTNVLTIASDNQQVTLANDEAEILIRLKKQSDFGMFEKGKEYASVLEAKEIEQNSDEAADAPKGKTASKARTRKSK